MEIIKLTLDKYKEWDDFCLYSDDAWFWHTSQWLEYNLDYQPELKSQSKSFMAVDNNKIIAICPLILETHKKIKEFSYGGGYCPTPAFSNNLTKKTKEKVIKFVFKHIDGLAGENNIKRAMFKFSVLNKSYIEPSEQRFNYLMKFGYLDTLINTHVINLKMPIKKLRQEIRHGHDYDIDKASKILKAEIFDKNNITPEIFEKYVDLHYKAAGRITRPRSTFEIMRDLIKANNAFLAGAKKDNVFIGFSYFFLFKNNVYYGSSCNDPDAPNIPIAHFIQWNAIKWMSEQKCHFYEIGWQNYSNTLPDFPSPKEINIGRFKRGFGGFTVPLFRAEKYYNKEYFLQIYQERINKYADLIK